MIVGLFAGLAMAGCGLLVQAADPPAALDGERLSRLGLDLIAPLGSGFAAGLLIQGLLPVVEGVFRISTAMTLERPQRQQPPAAAAARPEAPGTYQHSLRIADMAEAAAEAVGGDGLLARTGAMYHDIGKIHKPQYFVENEGGGENRHDKLSPAMSLLIIVNHVKDGAVLAREYDLPRQIVDFIETHHGTTPGRVLLPRRQEQGRGEEDARRRRLRRREPLRHRRQRAQRVPVPLPRPAAAHAERPRSCCSATASRPPPAASPTPRPRSSSNSSTRWR